MENSLQIPKKRICKWFLINAQLTIWKRPVGKNQFSNWEILFFQLDNYFFLTVHFFYPVLGLFWAKMADFAYAVSLKIAFYKFLQNGVVASSHIRLRNASKIKNRFLSLTAIYGSRFKKICRFMEVEILNLCDLWK